MTKTQDMIKTLEEVEMLVSDGFAVMATCYPTGEEVAFTPQSSKHFFYFNFDDYAGALEYYLAEETATGKGGYALLEDYGACITEVVEVESLHTYVQEVHSGTPITKEEYEHMYAVAAL